MISIVMPNYNKEDFIVQAVESILRQTSSDWELIIVDDCSTDDSIKAISALTYGNDKVKIIFNDVNRGANYCRNIGFKNSSFDWIMFFDSDDLLSDVCIENRLSFIKNSSGNYDFFVFSLKSFEIDILDNNKLWIPIKKNALNRFLSHDLPWQTMQTLWSKRSLKKINGFDNDFVRMQDVEIHTRALFKKLSFNVCEKKPDCFYRIEKKRIKDYKKYVNEFSDSVIMYYLKFYNYCDKRQKKILFSTLIETLIYVENIIRTNDFYPSFVTNTRQKFFDLTDSKLRYLVLKFISIIYSNRILYPYGLKLLIKNFLKIESYLK